MNPAFPPCLNPTEWTTLYRAVIHETNQSLLSQRVSEAEDAVIERGREISYDHRAADEKDALEDALYVLRAYRSARQHARTCIPL